MAWRLLTWSIVLAIACVVLEEALALRAFVGGWIGPLTALGVGATAPFLLVGFGFDEGRFRGGVVGLALRVSLMVFVFAGAAVADYFVIVRWKVGLGLEEAWPRFLQHLFVQQGMWCCQIVLLHLPLALSLGLVAPFGAKRRPLALHLVLTCLLSTAVWLALRDHITDHWEPADRWYRDVVGPQRYRAGGYGTVRLEWAKATALALLASLLLWALRARAERDRQSMPS